MLIKMFEKLIRLLIWIKYYKICFTKSQLIDWKVKFIYWFMMSLKYIKNQIVIIYLNIDRSFYKK